MRVRRLACEHCGARAWVEGVCLRCGKPMTVATAQAEVNTRREATTSSSPWLSQPALLILGLLLVVALGVMMVATLIAGAPPHPVVVFIAMMFGFVILAKLRKRAKR